MATGGTVKYTLLTILTLGAATIASGQPPFQGLTSIDAHALNAVQFTFGGKYGPGTVLGSSDCPAQKSNSVGYCVALANFNVPAGKRLVIENISAGISFNPNGSGAVFGPTLSVGLTVGGTTAFTNLPLETTLTVGSTTYYSTNRSLRLYADPGAGFPELLFQNITGGIGPNLGGATGAFSVTVSGYYVPTT
jgi:hypothetical protein